MKFSYRLFLPSSSSPNSFYIYICIISIIQFLVSSVDEFSRAASKFPLRGESTENPWKIISPVLYDIFGRGGGKERVTRCASHVFHSVKRTANNFVINCIKLSVRKTVYAPASSRVCGTINWTARARFVFFFLFFFPLSPLSLSFFFLFFFSTEPENLMFRIRRTH